MRLLTPLVTLSSLLALIGVACGGSTSTGAQNCAVGAERCACTMGGACNAGLVCLSNVCVSLDGALGGSSGGASSGVSGSSSSGAASSSGTGSSSGSSMDGGGSSGAADANVQDVASEARGSGGVTCGTGAQSSRCTGTQVCCIQRFMSSCQAASATCTGTPVSCASVADCPQGQVCCGTLGGAGTYTAVSCQSTCGADAGTVQYPFCDLNAPVCPTGTTCRASTVLTGYAVCR